MQAARLAILTEAANPNRSQFSSRFKHCLSRSTACVIDCVTPRDLAVKEPGNTAIHSSSSSRTMLEKHFRHVIAGLLALAFATSLFARGQFWDFLGYIQVDGSQDHGRIQITRRDVRSRTIQLRISGEAVFFDRLVVYFDDGACQELIVNDRILPGTRDYVIGLPGERSLASVELWYYKESWGHNPTVSLYGVRWPQSDGQNFAQQH